MLQHFHFLDREIYSTCAKDVYRTQLWFEKSHVHPRNLFGYFGYFIIIVTFLHSSQHRYYLSPHRASATPKHNFRTWTDKKKHDIYRTIHCGNYDVDC